MKIKTVYVYLLLLFVALIVIVISSTIENNNTNSENISDTKMPEDDVHRQLNMGAPSGNNVSSEFLTKMNNLKMEVERNPNDTLKLRTYADLLTAAHKQEEAIRYYSQILNMDPSRKDILTSLAIIYYNKNDFIEAKAYITKIIDQFPDDEEAQYNLGLIEARIGDLEAARKQWQDIITNHPNSKMSELAKNALTNLSDK